MSELKVEVFTATDAVDAGLIQSIRRGECLVTGNAKARAEKEQALF